MATSSITKNFVVEGEEQVQMFANAIEESYQESLTRGNTCHVRYHDVETAEDVDELTKKRDEASGYESLDGLSYEDLNEETQAAIDEARSLLKSPSAKYYNTAAEAFDDVLGTDWRK